MPGELHPVTLRRLEDIPPFLADADQIQSTADPLFREMVRVDDALAELRANFWPQLADAYLKIWENLLGLAVESPELSLAQRRNAVLAFLQGIRNQSSGISWEATLTKLIGTAWSYEEHIPGDAGSPPENSVRITIPFTAPIPAPTGLTGTPFTTGGTLSATTRYYVVTAVNAYGETTISNRVAVTTTGSTSRVVLDWPDVTGATGYRVYRATTSGQEKRIVEVSASTYTDTGAANGTIPYPTANQTASPQAYQAEALARDITPAHIDLIFGYGVGFIVGVSQVGEEPL